MIKIIKATWTATLNLNSKFYNITNRISVLETLSVSVAESCVCVSFRRTLHAHIWSWRPRFYYIKISVVASLPMSCFCAGLKHFGCAQSCCERSKDFRRGEQFWDRREKIYRPKKLILELSGYVESTISNNIIKNLTIVLLVFSIGWFYSKLELDWDLPIQSWRLPSWLRLVYNFS